jgi:hypothetical protein
LDKLFYLHVGNKSAGKDGRALLQYLHQKLTSLSNSV